MPACWGVNSREILYFLEWEDGPCECNRSADADVAHASKQNADAVMRQTAMLVFPILPLNLLSTPPANV
jgi:hypothetical protein